MAAQGAGVSPSFLCFFFSPKSQLARSLSLGDFMCQTAYPPRAAPCRDAAAGRAGECEPECARVGACAWEARLPPGRWRGPGCSSLRAFRWSLRTCGCQSVSLSRRQRPSASSPCRAPSSGLSLPHQLLPPLIRSAVPAASPGGWRMQVTGPELPSRVGLGLRCLHFGTSTVAMATWGA